MICIVEGCDKSDEHRRFCRGMCQKHYVRYTRHGDPHFTKYRKAGDGHITFEGYKLLEKNGVKILEHRDVMQKFLGRKLMPHECVHHLNEDKLDNRIENLQVMSWSDHAKLHAKERIRKGRDVKCPECGKQFYVMPHRLKQTDNPSCSRKCRGAALRKGERNYLKGRKHF